MEELERLTFKCLSLPFLKTVYYYLLLFKNEVSSTKRAMEAPSKGTMLVHASEAVQMERMRTLWILRPRHLFIDSI